MQCPRCRCNDVYLSQSGNSHVLSFLLATARCHRCCYTFKAPRWSLTEKPPRNEESEQQPVAPPLRRAA